MVCMHRRAVGTASVVLSVALLPVAARAQNGSNYHVLNNGADTAFIGVGAGGNQTAADGLLTWVAGEDLRGSHRLHVSGDFGYRLQGFMEQMCVYNQGPGPLALRFPAVVFTELDGLNGNAPAIFTNPVCSPPSFPLGTSGFVPYGTGPGSSASFVLTGLQGLGISTAAQMLLPNNGLSPSSAGGTATVVGAASASLPINSVGFCWAVQFTWVPSALGSLDDIDGWAHFVANSPDLNQYWQMSENEEALWQSQSVATDGGAAVLHTFFANDDYALNLRSVDPVTLATIAPRAGTTPYSGWTTNVSNEYGVVQNPNGGFDVGRGSSAVSFRSRSGVPNPVTGVGNQDDSLGPGSTPTIGFATWDNGGDHTGSVRLTWLSIDLLGQSGGNPDTDPGVLESGGTLRVPVVSAGLVQPVTNYGFTLFGHVTQFGFVAPLPSSFDIPIGGASWQWPIASEAVPCFAGMTFNITYGTSGRLGSLGAPGPLTWDPKIADVSGTKQVFLFD